MELKFDRKNNPDENTLKSKQSLKNLTCCVFAVFLSLLRASGGRFGLFSAERSMRQKIAQNGLQKLVKAIKIQQTHNR